MSCANSATYEAVETGYDPGQHVVLDNSSLTSSPALSKARTTSKPAAHHDYKPTALRWWFQVVLIACLATFIGLTEYTIQTLQAYNGGDLASQLLSREDGASYRKIERKSKLTEAYFRHLPRTFSNSTTATSTATTYPEIITSSDFTTTTSTGLQIDTTDTMTTSIAFLGDGKISSTLATDLPGTKSSVCLSQEIITTKLTQILETTSRDMGDTSVSTTIPTAYFDTGRVTPKMALADSGCTMTVTIIVSITSPYLQTETTTSAATSAYLQIGPTTSLETLMPSVSNAKSAGLHLGSTTSQSPEPTSSTTTEHDTTATKDTSAYIQIGPTSLSTVSELTSTDMAQSVGLQLSPTTLQSPAHVPWTTETGSSTSATKDTSAYLLIGPASSPTVSTTESDSTSASTDASVYLQVGPTSTPTSLATEPEGARPPGPFLQVGPTSSPTMSTTEPGSTPTSTDASAYLQVGPTSSPTLLVTEPDDGGISGTYLQIGATLSPTFSATEAESTWVPKKETGYIQIGSTSYPTSVTAAATSVTSASLQLGPVTIAIRPTAPTSEGGVQEDGGPSWILFDPNAATSIQDAAGETPSVTVVQGTKTWAPSETWIEQTTTDSAGQSTVQNWKTTLPGSSEIFQSTIPVTSEGEQEIVTVIQQTETWASSETTIQHTTTLSDGQTIVQSLNSMLPGGTRTIQSTIPVSSISVPSEGKQEDVTVIQQTETWPSSEITVLKTTTNVYGQTFVQTFRTTSPGGTRIVQSSVSVQAGETLVTVPTVVPTTIGGSMEVVRTTFSDSQGHTTTSSYTTVLGGTTTFTTRSFFIATSLPPDYTVITIPTVVPTTLGGTTEFKETTFTNAHGSLTTSSYMTIIGETPTSTTISIVIATPVPSGKVLVSISTVVSTTIGGTTEVIQTSVTDSHGQLTTSSYTTVLHGTPTSTTEWTIVPTPTYAGSSGNSPNNSDSSGDTRLIVYGLSLEEYMLGTFLPTILTVLVAYPVKLISINARLMQPFHTLATADKTHGATPESSIFQSFDRWLGLLSLPLAIKKRQPVIAISDLLVLGAALLTPLAAETVGVHVPDGCQSHCNGSLGVSVAVGRILEALMATMAALLIALVVLLSVFRWETGVSQNPWSIAGMASLCLDPEIRDILRSIPKGLNGRVQGSEILKALGKNGFALGNFWIAPNCDTLNSKGYGVIVAGRDGVARQLLDNEDTNGEEAEKLKTGGKRTQPFKLLTWWGRCLLIFVLYCILIILVYYETTSADTGFERFMDSQGFGVNFFFTALGVIVGACMEMVFRSVAIISPYLQLSNDNLPAERSILLSPPTNAFYGLYSSARQRHVYLGVLSFTTILGELVLPVTLSHVPFSLIETYRTQLVCAWMSIGILALMILVLAWSFLTAWPHMPVDPRTVAGAMFYVCDSWMLETMQGMSRMGKGDRDLDVRYLRLRYAYGYVSGVSGNERMGVDVCDDTGEAAVIMRGEKLRYS